MKIGPHSIQPPLILAPMAGVTDRPYRSLCRAFGAGLAVSEMTSADPRLRHTDKSRLRRDHAGEQGPIAVQIAGYDPVMMADAARFNRDQGAEIIDLNFGCPAKKVCRVDAGSALMRDVPLITRIVAAVVAAVDVPVTLKMRTGWSRADRNAVQIARIAESEGIAALAVHGRTREDRYEGAAEYQTLAAVNDAVSIPVIANGDIDSPEKALAVRRITGCEALMIGRAALGRPWVFRDWAHFIASGQRLPGPSRLERRAILLGHLDELYAFYGEPRGLRVARKHIQWALADEPGAPEFWPSVNQTDSAAAQRQQVEAFFDRAEDPLAGGGLRSCSTARGSAEGLDSLGPLRSAGTAEPEARR